MTVVGVLLFLALANASKTYCADASAPEDPVLRASVDFSAVDKADVRFRGASSRMSETYEVSPTVFGQVAINDKWFIPAGFSSEHIFLDTVKGAPVPSRINVMRLNTGVGYRFNSEWSAEIGVGPLFYDLNRVDGGTIGFGGMIRSTWKVNPDLLVVGGLSIAPDSEVPVFPAAGAIWSVSSNVTLNLIVPKPRVIYRVAKGINVYAGAEVRFAVFRTGEEIQDRTGVAGFNRALGTYRDIHLGAGAEFTIAKGLYAGFEAGYSVGRLIDYTRIDERVRFESAPYVHLGARYQF